MFNVPTKFTGIILATVVLAVGGAGCSGSGTDENGVPLDPAEALAYNIEKSLDEGDYSGVIILTDSLNRTYPDRIELRRGTMLPRARAMEGLIRDSIPLADAELASLQLRKDSLMQFFVPVRERGLPGYIVDKGVTGVSLVSGNAVQPRLGDALSPWSLAVSVSGNPGITGLAIDVDGKTTTVSADDAASRRVKGAANEMFSFTASEADVIGATLDGTGSQSAILKVLCGSREVTIKMSPAVQKAVARTYQLSQVREAERKALLHRELLERKLIVAQNQIANLQTDTLTTK